MSSQHVVILAAGQGKRMQSKRPKVLHEVGGRSLVQHVVQTAFEIKSSDVTLVVPQKSEDIQAVFKIHSHKSKIQYATQMNPRGTGDALKAALKKISAKEGQILVLNADMPFVSSPSLRALLAQHCQKKAAVSLLTACVSDPKGLGRIVRASDQSVKVIVEEKDASPLQKKINEINLGVYVFDLAFVKNSISKITTKNKQKEYYITDLIIQAVKQSQLVLALPVKNKFEAHGVNSQADLHQLNHEFYIRQRYDLMQKGVSFIGDSVFVDGDVKVGAGTRIESPCYLKGQTRIGQNVIIEAGCTIKNSIIKEGALIKSHTYIDDAIVGVAAQVGPFAHLRPGTELMQASKVGNFVEIKKTVLGMRSKASHLTYLGDAKIGKDVNVGAGTITCNYDGYNKFKTVLEDGVFIGSDSQLVAPVKVGHGAYVAAGTTVTSNVSANSLVVSRVKQKEIAGWAKTHRQKNLKK